MELTGITEGTTEFFIPMQDMRDHFPPGTAPVFFNRKMMINRDATILLLSVLQPSDYLDAMGASGARGLRVANECGISVTINDRDPSAVELVKCNAERLNLPVEVIQKDTNSLMSERAFDSVDLDPFGTPAPFVDSAIRGTKRFLFVTATDTAPLCGAHLKAGIRRYFARPMNTDYHSEVGLRVLLGFMVRETVKYDRGILPLFSFAHEHFVRIHARILRGADAADRTLARLGYIHQCPKCPYREEQKGMFPEQHICPHCGVPLHQVGPLWLGEIQDKETLNRMLEILPEKSMGSRKELEKLLPLCRDELPTSSFYDYHAIAKVLRTSPPDIMTAIARLQEAGYPATRTHFSGYGIKTEAPLEMVYAAIRPSGNL